MPTQPLQFGPLILDSNVLLAPIANYCDLAFRTACRSMGGVGLASTDLLSPQGLLRGTAKSLDLAHTDKADSPLCMQLYGFDADALADGARWAVDHGADVVDINMGCPVDKVAKKNGGSLLLRDPCSTVALANKVVEAVRTASNGTVPTTAKVRLGWDADSIVAPQLARSLEGVGIAAITVHGRTTEQRFKGDVHIDGIAAVVAAVESIPVLGNGDIKTPEDAVRMIEATSCAGVMIGRGALAKPWIFRDCWALQTTGIVPPEPSDAKKIELIRRYFEDMQSHRGAHYAMTHIRRRISWFAKTLGPCKPFKEAVRLAKDPDAVTAAFDSYLAGELRMYERDTDRDPTTA